MTETGATGYDCLSSRLVSESDLRAFLLSSFEIAQCQLFVGHDDRVAEELRVIPQDVVFCAFCTYREVSGHFAMAFGVSIEGWLADRVGRREFAERFAAHFDAYVLYGDTEPPGLWTVILADGERLRVAMDEGGDRYELYAATAPVPGLPDVAMDQGLWQLRYLMPGGVFQVSACGWQLGVELCALRLRGCGECVAEALVTIDRAAPAGDDAQPAVAPAQRRLRAPRRPPAPYPGRPWDTWVTGAEGACDYWALIVSRRCPSYSRAIRCAAATGV
ncbi:hypothetical protein [Streptomyces sp. NPDC002209]|uniref:hypothetical protein n=1 Tax=Streptomyces sp. NPDC002209 TaxID=3364638 RepID=UPI0036B686C1